MILHVSIIICAIGIAAGNRKNVLCLVSDDMRPQIDAYYGPDFPSPVHPEMHTPTLSALANKSLVMKRAYVQQALCSPSRTSFLTSRRPDTTHVYDLKHYFRKVGGNFTTLPEYFKLNGYRTIGMGKIFHPGQKASGHDDPISWTDPYFHATQPREYEDGNSWFAVPVHKTKKRPLQDTQLANHAIEVLKKVAPQALSGQQPFFLALGVHKPHLPFVFPDNFLSYYPENEIKLPPNLYAPVGMPDVAWHTYGGLIHFKDIKATNATGAINTTLPFDVIRKVRRAYYSALSYADYELGRVISELDRLKLANSTIVSFVGDHGWQLGEHGEWCKQTNFELATHAPMMIHIPGLTDHGMSTEKLTEFVDLYPTITEAAGLPVPALCLNSSTTIDFCTEGMSLVPLIKNPSAKWKTAAFSQYPRNVNGTYVMGYTMRTEDFRYTEWARFSGEPVYKPDWSVLFGVELYYHTNDPEENLNRANDPAFMSIRKELSKQLRTGWRGALPQGN